MKYKELALRVTFSSHLWCGEANNFVPPQFVLEWRFLEELHFKFTPHAELTGKLYLSN